VLAKTSSKFLLLKIISPEDGNCNVGQSVEKLSPFYTGYTESQSHPYFNQCIEF
jgi:hypothetical protein